MSLRVKAMYIVPSKLLTTDLNSYLNLFHSEIQKDTGGYKCCDHDLHVPTDSCSLHVRGSRLIMNVGVFALWFWSSTLDTSYRIWRLIGHVKMCVTKSKERKLILLTVRWDTQSVFKGSAKACGGRKAWPLHEAVTWDEDPAASPGKIRQMSMQNRLL